MYEPLLTDAMPFHPRMTIDGRSDGPVIDTLYEFPGIANSRLYVHPARVRDWIRLLPDVLAEVARERGFVDGEEHATALAERDATIAALTEEVEEARAAGVNVLDEETVRRVLSEATAGKKQAVRG